MHKIERIGVGWDAPKMTVCQFCVLADKIPFDEVVLKDIFRFGLSEPIKSWLPEGKFEVSLKDFMDNALLCAVSLFTVAGVREQGVLRVLQHPLFFSVGNCKLL